MRRAAPALALALLALAGCLADDEPSTAVCHARLTAADVPDEAVAEAGDGPRAVTVRSTLAHEPVLLWWPGHANGTVEYIGLRAGDGQSQVVGYVPDDRDVGVLARPQAPMNAPAHWAYAVRVPAGPSDVTLDATEAQLGGSLSGVWSTPASFGAGPMGPAWQPNDLPEVEANLDRLLELELVLRWTNGPAGGGDLGIAFATGDATFHYVNAEVQATPGAQREARVLEADELRANGWGNGTPPRAGPSVSTGAFATTGLAYTLDWVARLKPAGTSEGLVCAELGPVREVDVTRA